MDVLAHGLWANVMFKIIPKSRHDKKLTWWGIACGVLPDLLTFTPIFALLFFDLIVGRRNLTGGRPDLDNFPLGELTHQLYNYTHSFVIFALAVIVVWAIWKKFPIYFLGWGLHVFIDIFTHSREFYPTPFLFPIVPYEFNGFPWSHPVFMVVNYGALLLLYLVVLPKLKKKPAPISAVTPEEATKT
jgi:hypothetical protein